MLFPCRLPRVVASALAGALAACVADPSSDRAERPAETDTVEGVGGDSVPGSDSSASTDTSPTGTDTTPTEPEDTWPRPCADLYDPESVPTFGLEFSDGEWGALRNDCASGVQDYHPVTFTYDGETVPAQVRLKGNWSWSCDKLQFVVSFNEGDPDGRFHGLRKLMLDAPWYDQTLLHERLAFPVFAARGLPYSCVNNVRLDVDGAYYGLYANIERIDKEYLERHFEDSGGNLYQAGTELKTNEDAPDTSDLDALAAATTVEQLAAVVDLDEAVAEWATEAMLPAMDNYWAGVEINYYLYDNPGAGFVYLPYDLDITFGDASYGGGNLIWPDAVSSDPILYEHSGWRKEELFQRVLADPAWCTRFVQELTLTRAAYDPEALAARLGEWDAQIRDALEADTHRTFPMSDHDLAVAQLGAFFADRAAFVDDWLATGGHCPARW